MVVDTRLSHTLPAERDSGPVVHHAGILLHQSPAMGLYFASKYVNKFKNTPYVRLLGESQLQQVS